MQEGNRLDPKVKKPTRREFLAASGAALSLPWMKRPVEALRLEPVKNPRIRNVVLILSDDHRFDFLGFMGKPPFLRTPNMDRMAREGAHLANTFVVTALCSPSRASILTGLYTHKHQVVDNNFPIPEGTVFFPQYLEKAGFETAFIGKWHMGHEKDDPRPGFDRWVSFRGQGVYTDPVLNVDGRRVEKKGYITDILTEYAVDWIRKDRKKPFFLFFAHKAVHDPFTPAGRHQGAYQNAEIAYPPSMADTEENYRGKPRWVREQRNSWHGVDYMYHGRIDFDTFYRNYCECLLGLDESIGTVLDTIEETGLAGTTLVFYMGDNGFTFGEHGLIDKRHMYEESVRVPLLAWCPGCIRAGTRIERMVQNIDIAPTVLEAMGLKPPSSMDGRSFLPLLEGKEIAWRDAIFYEYYWERNFPQTPTMHGIRTGRYKYIHYHGIWDVDELYDLQNDSREMENLIQRPEYQKLVQELNKRLFDWLDNTGGMKIPLKRDFGIQLAERKPKSG